MKDEREHNRRSRRTYRSDVRVSKKEETRQRILDALIAKMVQGNIESVSMDAIAEAAGVGPATLYRHFPNREALWDGLSNEFNRLVGSASYPRTPTEIAEFLKRDFATFDSHPGLVQAFFMTDLGRKARSRGRSRRLNAIREALAGVLDGLPEPRQVQVTAVIAYLASLQSWITMTAEFGLSGAQVGEAVTWALHTLVQAAEQEKPPHDQ